MKEPEWLLSRATIGGWAGPMGARSGALYKGAAGAGQRSAQRSRWRAGSGAGRFVRCSVSFGHRPRLPACAPRDPPLSNSLFLLLLLLFFFLPALPGDSGSSSGAFGLRGAMLVAEAAPAPGPAEKLGERFSVLTWEQVQRLDQILGEAVPIHGRGNFPTLSVRPRTIVQVRPGAGRPG